jgi:hypothetical protein
MKLKRWWRVIMLGGLVVALSAPSAMAWTNRPVVGHNPNFQGAAPHGPAYGYRGQRPGWNHGNAYGRQHRNQWNHRNPNGAYHRGAWGQQQRSGQFHNPNLGRPNAPHNQYSNAGYRFGPPR